MGRVKGDRNKSLPEEHAYRIGKVANPASAERFKPGRTISGGTARARVDPLLSLSGLNLRIFVIPGPFRADIPNVMNRNLIASRGIRTIKRRDRTSGGSHMPSETARHIQATGGLILRYGLVVIILWFGVFKFTAAEAEAIAPLLTNSPVLGWAHALLGERNASRAIGVAEIVIAILIALRPVRPSLSVLGSVGAIGMFLTTLSFLATTPGMFTVIEGLPVPSGIGGFVIKDVVLLGAAVWTAGDALQAGRSSRSAPARVARQT